MCEGLGGEAARGRPYGAGAQQCRGGCVAEGVMREGGTFLPLPASCGMGLRVILAYMFCFFGFL